MPPITEIRKLSKEIKEVPKEKKIESIDDEFEEDESDPAFHPRNPSFSLRRSNKTSTLESTGEKQDTFEDRQQNRAVGQTEGRSTINFYAAASGGNPYKSNAYTPVGSAESSAKTRDLAERDLGNNRDSNMNNQGNSTERSYAGEQDQGEKKDRKRNLM